MRQGGAKCGQPGGAKCGRPGGAKCGRPGGAKCGRPGGAKCGQPGGAKCGRPGGAKRRPDNHSQRTDNHIYVRPRLQPIPCPVSWHHNPATISISSFSPSRCLNSSSCFSLSIIFLELRVRPGIGWSPTLSVISSRSWVRFDCEANIERG